MIYNAFPSTTGEVEEGSINGTAEVPFKEIGLKGNTSQNGEPTPDTPIPVNVVTGDNEVIVSNEDNTQSQTYPINLGSMELCKIGDYQDRFIRTRGKNLVDILNGTIVKRESATYTNINRTANTLSYNITTTFTGYLGFVIPIEIGKQYTLSFDRTSGDIYTIELDNMITEVGTNYGSPRTSGYSFTATKPYIGIWAIANTDGGNYASISNLILNEGTTALPYEPYGKVWYKYGAIGKVVLNGSENWSQWGPDTFYITKLSSVRTGLSNYYKYNSTVIGGSQLNNGEFFIHDNIHYNVVIFRNTSYTTVADFKTWLSTHNTTLYYVLETPTYTLLNDTLQTQLDSIQYALAYDTQTNISQTNKDLPFIIDAETYVNLKELDLKQLSTFDRTKTQVLKNINGTLTWVDES